MKNDLKKKFLDILFEPEDEMVIEDNDVSEVKGLKSAPVKEVKREEVKPSKNVKATDLMYGNSNSFINLETKEVKKEVKPEPKEVTQEAYEFKQQNISPIFGNIDPKHVKKEEPKKPVTSQTTINTKDYQGIIFSPIFGYDNSSAEKARVDFIKNKNKDSALLKKKVENYEEVRVVEPKEETISLFDEPFDEPLIDEEVFKEPFTTEIKVIDIEGEPIEEVEEEYDEPLEEISSYELEDLDVLDNLGNEEFIEEIKQETSMDETDEIKMAEFDMDSISSANAKSFIDDLLGDKD